MPRLCEYSLSPGHYEAAVTSEPQMDAQDRTQISCKASRALDC